MALAAPADEDADVADRTRPEPFTLEWQHVLVGSLHDSLLATQAASPRPLGDLSRAPCTL